MGDVRPLAEADQPGPLLSWARKEATLQRGTAQEVRLSLGGRISRPIATERSGWDFDDEALWQFGSFGSNDIQAWTVATETGYRIPTIPLKPRFSAKADISSGDNPNSKTLGTFNALFPKDDYFGVLATTGPGPINFIDVPPHVETMLPHDVSVSFDWIVQWRENPNDAVYNVPGFIVRAADGSRARFVGHRPGTQIRWQVNRHLWFQADYGIFYAGRFLKETQPGRNLNYWALWAGSSPGGVFVGTKLSGQYSGRGADVLKPNHYEVFLWFPNPLGLRLISGALS